MKTSTRAALLLSIAVVLGGSGVAFAQMDGPQPPDGPMQGLLHRARLADRLVADFDANHDGKITHAELNNALGTRFASATHKAKLMSPDQFLAIHLPDFQKHTVEIFRRVDWNADGRLTLEEFAAPQRAHFQMMDGEGAGTVSCNPFSQADYRGDGSPSDNRDGWRGRDDRGGFSGRRGGRGFGGFGRSRFCADSDTSRDGRVTRAEFDAVTARQFSSAAGGGAALALAQFAAGQAVRYRDMNAKMFERLDNDGDGKLSLAEFAAPPEKLFDRLDRNRDGTITSDEMKPRFRGRDGGGWGRGRGGDRAPRQDRTY